MKSFTKMLPALCLLMLASFAHAETEKSLDYQNQKETAFDLENWLKETKYTTEEVPGTCQRQIPYQENVCRDVTKYKKECADVPAHQECSDVNRPVCHNETTYETQCTPAIHQECHTENNRSCHDETTYENQCTTIPGEQECRIVIRYHEECGRGQPCHQAPYEERECSMGTSHEECRQIPRTEEVCQGGSREVCEEVSDSPVCRDYPTTERVCEDNIETECENIPTQNVCKDVPYNENVCGMETKYRTEDYACMKTIQIPHVVTLKTHKAHVQMTFDNKSTHADSSYKIALTEKGEVNLSLKRDNVDLIIFAKKTVKNVDKDSINSIAAIYNIVMLDHEEFFEFIDGGINDISLQKNSLSFSVVGKIEAARAKLAINISKKEDVKLNKTIKNNQFSSEFDGEKTIITIDLEKLNVPKLGGLINREHDVTLKLSLDYSDLGDNTLSDKSEFSVSAKTSVKVK